MKRTFTYRLPETPLQYEATIQTTVRRQQSEQNYIQRAQLSVQTIKGKGWLAAPALLVEKNVAPWVYTLDNPADKLVAELQEALSGLQLKMQPNGQPAEILNHSQVWQQWQVLRDKLAYTYQGDWPNGILQHTDSTLLHKDRLLATFLKDLTWQEYFRNIYQVSWNGVEMPATRMVYGIAGNTGIPLQESRRFTDHRDQQQFSIKGYWKELRPLDTLKRWKKHQQLSVEAAPLVVSYEGDYFLQPATGQCAGLTAAFRLQAGDDYEKTIRLNLVSLTR
ncbi:hypothetical protein [Chitinophaga vietnamensis]|uniref:hypothetical protein n=1 Tax=Chitinophaga vietnamensis TaxID=2593957 RepID=UPI001177F3A4|nr:hypothetical protein [Chitinophaga vietnamensis]